MAEKKKDVEKKVDDKRDTPTVTITEGGGRIIELPVVIVTPKQIEALNDIHTLYSLLARGKTRLGRILSPAMWHDRIVTREIDALFLGYGQAQEIEDGVVNEQLRLIHDWRVRLLREAN